MGGGEVSRLRLGAEFIGARNTAQIEYARVGGREGVRGYVRAYGAGSTARANFVAAYASHAAPDTSTASDSAAARA